MRKNSNYPMRWLENVLRTHHSVCLQWGVGADCGADADRETGFGENDRWWLFCTFELLLMLEYIFRTDL